MALFEKETRFFLFGAGSGVALVLAAPHLSAVAAAVARPLLKATIKQGYLALDRSREALGRIAETVEDVVAEVKSELDEELRDRLAAADEGPVADTGDGKASSGKPN